MIVAKATTLKGQPLKDVSQTVDEMKRLINSYYTDMSFAQSMTIEDFYKYVKRIPYVEDEVACQAQGYDPAKYDCEFVQRPALTVERGGDCDDKVVVAASYMKLRNIPYRIVTVSYRPDKQFEHVYLYIWYGGVWLPFDPTLSTVGIFKEHRPYTALKVWS